MSNENLSSPQNLNFHQNLFKFEAHLFVNQRGMHGKGLNLETRLIHNQECSTLNGTFHVKLK